MIETPGWLGEHRPTKRFAAVAEGRGRSEALALRLALRVGMLAAQQNRETLGRARAGGRVTIQVKQDEADDGRES